MQSKHSAVCAGLHYQRGRVAGDVHIAFHGAHHNISIGMKQYVAPLEIEKAALKKETDDRSQERLKKIDKEIAELKETKGDLWENGVPIIDGCSFPLIV